MTVQKDVCSIRVYGKMFEPIYNGLFSFLSSQYNGYYDPFVLFDAIQFDKLNKRPYAVLFRFLSTYVKSKLMHFWGFYGPKYVLNILKSVWIDLLKLFKSNWVWIVWFIHLSTVRRWMEILKQKCV